MTAVFEVPLTVALNCWLVLITTCAVAGETLTETGPVTLTVALADFVESATDVAVTVTCRGFGGLAGAV